MKPRILHVITGLEVGGAEMMLVKTLPKLTGYEHTVATLLGEGPLAAPLKAGGVRVVHLRLNKQPFKAIGAFRRLAAEHPDLMISYLIHADLFTRLFAPLFGLKRRVTFVRNNLIGSKYHHLLRLERATQWLVKAYFSVSRSVAEMYIEQMHYPREKFTVIANGIEPGPFEEAKPLSNQELGLKKDDKIVLMVGKFFAQKGHTYLIQAWPRVLKAYPEARLLFAGGGPMFDEIKEKVHTAGLDSTIQFLGVRSDVPRLLKTCDIFVFPTLFEGMSNALLEAMVSGCTIVTTNIPENKEVATESEVCFVPPRDPEALAKALIETLRHPGDMGKKAKKHVEDHFLVKHTVAALDAAYKRILSS